jgi:hypothetical protein
MLLLVFHHLHRSRSLLSPCHLSKTSFPVLSTIPASGLMQSHLDNVKQLIMSRQPRIVVLIVPIQTLMMTVMTLSAMQALTA